MEQVGTAPEISVLMSVYNPKDKDSLFAAVYSIIAQSFESWEMILYDDGSDTDGAELIKEAAALDPRIVYAGGEENLGLGHGLNVSLALSRGKYIARMDGDDISRPGRFKKQYEFLESHPAYQWVGTNSELIDSDGRWGVWKMPKEPGPRDFLKFSPYVHPSVMFRRGILEECGGYNEDNRRAEDYDLFMRLHADGFKGYNLQEVLFCYREDRLAYSRRRFVFRIYEVGVRIRGFRRLGLLKFGNLGYVLKPVFVGLIPHGFLARIKRRVRKGTYVEGKKRRAA